MAVEACVEARNQGRQVEREGKEILTEAARHSPELAVAMDTWKEIKFEFEPWTSSREQSLDRGPSLKERLMDIQPYGPTPRHVETFSYLPPMTPERLRHQIAYVIQSGWTPAIEHTEPEKAFSNYWYLWELPYFGERSVDKVMAELDACHRANPGHHVRLIGYDNYMQSQGTAFTVHRAGAR